MFNRIVISILLLSFTAAHAAPFATNHRSVTTGLKGYGQAELTADGRIALVREYYTRTLAVWDVDALRCSWTWRAPLLDEFTDATLSADGQLVGAVTLRGRVLVQEVGTGRTLVDDRGAVDRSVMRLDFSADGAYLGIGLARQGVSLARVYDLRTGKVTYETSDSHEYAFHPRARRFLHAGRYASSSTVAPYVSVELATGATSAVTVTGFRPMKTRLSPSGELVYSENYTTVSDLRTGALKYRWTDDPAWPGDPSFASFSPSGAYLFAGALNQPLWIIDVEKGERLPAFAGASGEGVATLRAVFNHDETLVIGASPAGIGIWDIAGGELRGLLREARGGAYALALDETRGRLVAVGENWKIHVWDLAPR